MQGLGLRGWQGAGVGLTVGRLNSGILTNYLYKPGVAGGQTAFGGTATGQQLVLAGNTIDANAIVNVDGRLQVNHSGAGVGLQVLNPDADSIALGNLLQLTAAGSTPTGSPVLISVRPPDEILTGQRYTLLDAGGTVYLKGTGVPFVLFNVGPGWELDGIRTAGQVFFFAPGIDDGGVTGRTIGMNIRMHIINPTLAPLASGSVGTVTTITGMDMAPVVDASWNPVTVAQFISMGNPGGTHAVGITDLIGLNIPDTISKPTNVWSIRNVEDRARMHHRGSIYLGGGATPTQEVNSLLRITAGSAGGHGSITFDEEAADGPLPTLDNQARVYIKNNKFVIQWNLGGANLWTWVLLNPAGPYPVAAAWVTDVVAP